MASSSTPLAEENRALGKGVPCHDFKRPASDDERFAHLVPQFLLLHPETPYVV